MVGQLKAHLVVALAGAAVGHGVGPFGLGHGHLPLGDEWPGDGRAQQVAPFVDQMCIRDRLWGVMGLVYLWVFRMLWNLDPQGWMFVVVIAVFNLILAFLSLIGASTWQSMLPALLVNGLILIYGMLPGTKAAFDIAR